MDPSLALAALVALSHASIPASDIRLRIPDRTSSAAGDGPTLRIRPEPTASEELPPWELWVGAAPAYRPQTASLGATGRIGVNRRLGRVLRAELELGSGAYAQDRQTVSLMRLGVRAELPQARLAPFLYAGFAHHHEMSFEDAERAPLGAALGLSENGEIHRTGLDVGAGVVLTLPRAPRTQSAVRVALRGSVCSLLGAGPARTVDLLVAVGATF